MMNCAVIIPIYRDYLNPLEKFSLDNNIRKLNRFPIYFVIPKTLPTDFLQTYSDLRFVRFDDKFFQGYKGYNKLMLSEEFYRSFENYEKILICQLDAYVFSNRLEYFCNLPYDYIGAPAFLSYNEGGTCEIQPGNGGFSLRDVKNTLRLLKCHADERDAWKGTEDAFFSFCAMKYPKEFRMPTTALAVSFAFDRFVSTMYEWNDYNLPFGIHAWPTYASQFVCSFLTEEQNRLLDGVLRKYTVEEILCPLYAFMSRNSPIVLYGAGVWGKFVARAIQLLHGNVKCFVVSDGYAKPEQKILGIPVYWISEIDHFSSGTGAILSMEQRYLALEERKAIQKTCQEIRKRGVDEVFDIDSQLFSFVAEFVLRKEGRRF